MVNRPCFTPLIAIRAFESFSTSPAITREHVMRAWKMVRRAAGELTDFTLRR